MQPELEMRSLGTVTDRQSLQNNSELTFELYRQLIGAPYKTAGPTRGVDRQNTDT